MPEHIKEIYRLMLVRGYKARQLGNTIYLGRLTNHYKISFKKKKYPPILEIMLWPGKE